MQALGQFLRPTQIVLRGPLRAAPGVCLRRHGQPIGDAAGGLNQARRGQVGAVDHHARGKAHEARATIGLDGNDVRDMKARIAQQQPVAELQAKRLQQRRVDPGMAAFRNRPHFQIRLASSLIQMQHAAQRIAGLHALERHQTAGTTLLLSGPRHGRKAGRGHGLQPLLLCLLHKNRGSGVVADHHHIATQQLAGVTLQAGLQAVGKKAHRAQCRHGQQHGHDDQTQLASAQIAPEIAQPQNPDR